ncbi:Uncharacterized protein LSUE1_G008380 [Lachnellula suecica]|uniref:Protein MKT1 n=1 Tax=Lachnellula suecica TaxID=602035 RepID=A0A8T9BZH1_9HELO|nr:Uncharacterized protein LSUE1_G008380 [Lachnellula suecica]
MNEENNNRMNGHTDPQSHQSPVEWLEDASFPPASPPSISFAPDPQQISFEQDAQQFQQAYQQVMLQNYDGSWSPIPVLANNHHYHSDDPGYSNEISPTLSQASTVVTNLYAGMSPEGPASVALWNAHMDLVVQQIQQQQQNTYIENNADQTSHPAQKADPYILERRSKMPFSDMKDAHIGVDATAYLQHMIDDTPSHEPLLAALGGDPMTLKHYLEAELDLWKENKLTPVFVFDGMSSVGKDKVALRKAMEGLVQTEKAWRLYSDGHPETAVQTFGTSGAIRAQDLYRILQDILTERKLAFKVAPFSACAQLAHILSLKEEYIDGIMGSQELLLYEIHDAIIFPPTADDWDSKVFQGVGKIDIQQSLKVTPEMLADALLMVGTSFLSPFPPLRDPSIIRGQPASIKDAANLLRTSEKSVTRTCNAFSDILGQQDPNWLDKYQKAKMLVKHSCISHEDGRVEIKNYDTLTGDNTQYLGLRLPLELYYYLSEALIGNRLLDQFLHFKAMVFPTLDGVASDEYRRLVSKTLLPVKETTAALITPRLTQYFQHKKIELEFWFDSGFTLELDPANSVPAAVNKADGWGVKDADIKGQEAATGVLAGQLAFAVLSLQQNEFVAKSLIKYKGKNILKSKSEILSSTMWRLLHLRGYVNDKHELTSWGRALATTLKALIPVIKKYNNIHHIEEAAFLAFELLQFGNLNSRNRHVELIGGPLRGSDEEKASCLLIGRTACLLKLRHESVGYTGPLSKNLLSFHSIIKAVREADRDLVEAVTASIFLGGQASRTPVRKDWAALRQGLPFSADVDIALGIAVKTYLDDFVKVDLSQEERELQKSTYKRDYLPNCVDFIEDLDVAFKFFDAVHEGVKTLGGEIDQADKQAWDAAKAYLALRR